jgi:hypothetical protein
MTFFRPILSTFFAILVLFSGSNFVVGIHLCGSEIQNIALFGKAAGCEKEKKLPPCHRHQSTPCCQDETIIHDALAFNNDTTQICLAPVPAIDLAQPPALLREVIDFTSITHTQHHHYDPPLRSHDLTVALHVFLI